jgi:hypothetical protein
MSTENVNWGALIADSEDAFALVPKGKYTVRVKKAEATTSGNGKLMYKLTLEIINGPKTGSTLWTNVVLTVDNPKAVFMFFVNLQALGISKEYLKQDPAPVPATVAAKMVNAVIEIEVDHKPWQGVDREDVKILKGISAGGGSTPLPDGGSAGGANDIPTPTF